MIVASNLRGWRRELSAFDMSNGNPGVETPGGRQ